MKKAKIVIGRNGIRVRNIQRVAKQKTISGYSWIFEAELNGDWVRFGPFCCGDWSAENGVKGVGRTVPLGYQDIRSLWDKHPEARVIVEGRILEIDQYGMMLEADARKRASSLATTISSTITAGNIVEPMDLKFLNCLILALNKIPI